MLRAALALSLLAIAGAARADPPMSMPMPAAPAATPAKPAPGTPAAVQDTVIIGPTGKSLTVTPKLLGGMDRAEATMINHGVSHTYEGVRLTDLLRMVGAPTGALLHESADRDYLVVTGADGFRAVMSLAETDRSVQQRPVILADKMDGAAITTHDAPYRVVVDGDQKPARSVYAVTKIEVRVLP